MRSTVQLCGALCSCGAVFSAAGLLALQGEFLFMAERSADEL